MKQELLDKYNVPVPRYTSYPPANYFHDGFTSRDYADANPTASSRNRFPSIFIFLSANVSAIIADAIPTPLPSLKS